MVATGLYVESLKRFVFEKTSCDWYCLGRVLYRYDGVVFNIELVNWEYLKEYWLIICGVSFGIILFVYLIFSFVKNRVKDISTTTVFASFVVLISLAFMALSVIRDYFMGNYINNLESILFILFGCLWQIIAISISLIIMVPLRTYKGTLKKITRAFVNIICIVVLLGLILNTLIFTFSCFYDSLFSTEFFALSLSLFVFRMVVQFVLLQCFNKLRLDFKKV